MGVSDAHASSPTLVTRTLPLYSPSPSSCPYRTVVFSLLLEALRRFLPPAPVPESAHAHVTPADLAVVPLALARLLLYAVKRVERDLRHSAWTMVVLHGIVAWKCCMVVLHGSVARGGVIIRHVVGLACGGGTGREYSIRDATSAPAFLSSPHLTLITPYSSFPVHTTACCWRTSRRRWQRVSPPRCCGHG
jgi:hypothetical protein